VISLRINLLIILLFLSLPFCLGYIGYSKNYIIKDSNYDVSYIFTLTSNESSFNYSKILPSTWILESWNSSCGNISISKETFFTNQKLTWYFTNLSCSEIKFNLMFANTSPGKYQVKTELIYEGGSSYNDFDLFFPKPMDITRWIAAGISIILTMFLIFYVIPQMNKRKKTYRKGPIEMPSTERKVILAKQTSKENIYENTLKSLSDIKEELRKKL